MFSGCLWVALFVSRNSHWAVTVRQKVSVCLSVQVSAYVTITNMHMHNITLPIYMSPCSAVCTHRATIVQFSLLLFFVLQLPCVLIAEVAGAELYSTDLWERDSKSQFENIQSAQLSLYTVYSAHKHVNTAPRKFKISWRKNLPLHTPLCLCPFFFFFPFLCRLMIDLYLGSMFTKRSLLQVTSLSKEWTRQ